MNNVFTRLKFFEFFLSLVYDKWNCLAIRRLSSVFVFLLSSSGKSENSYSYFYVFKHKYRDKVCLYHVSVEVGCAVLRSYVPLFEHEQRYYVLVNNMKPQTSHTHTTGFASYTLISDHFIDVEKLTDVHYAHSMSSCVRRCMISNLYLNGNGPYYNSHRTLLWGSLHWMNSLSYCRIKFEEARVREVGTGMEEIMSELWMSQGTPL